MKVLADILWPYAQRERRSRWKLLKAKTGDYFQLTKVQRMHQGRSVSLSLPVSLSPSVSPSVSPSLSLSGDDQHTERANTREEIKRASEEGRKSKVCPEGGRAPG